VTGRTETIELAQCGACQIRFLPTDGPCPRCASAEVELYLAPAIGRVLAATELVVPAEGWASPHVLALVEVADAVRLLAIVDGETPAPGVVVSVRTDGNVFRARTEPGGEPA
jgi:uncharacterized OB-fold protein